MPPRTCLALVSPSLTLSTLTGIFVIGFSCPVVPKGKARIRSPDLSSAQRGGH